MTDLKTCPNCNSSNLHILEWVEGDDVILGCAMCCLDCDLTGPEMLTHKEAVAAWDNLPRRSDEFVDICKALVALADITDSCVWHNGDDCVVEGRGKTCELCIAVDNARKALAKLQKEQKR